MFGSRFGFAHVGVWLAGCLLAMPIAAQDLTSRDPVSLVGQLPGLVAFWTFQEAAGSPRRPVAGAGASLALIEQGGPIDRAGGGVFGEHCLDVRRGQFLKIDRRDIGPLDIHGPDAQVTVVAWVRRKTHTMWQAIAGVWDETRGKRQYCLFTNATKAMPTGGTRRVPVGDRVHGHVSDVGGPTPGYPYCVTYSTGATKLPLQKWVCLAMRYDGRQSSVFVDGRLDSSTLNNPLDHPGGLFDGGVTGADFTVGAVDRKNEWGNFFEGHLGGLAVYDRGLSEAELLRLGQIHLDGDR